MDGFTISRNCGCGFGVVPDGVITLAFDKNDPVSGLYLRTRRGWVVVPCGALTATGGRAPSTR